jgi:hypothetical protein
VPNSSCVARGRRGDGDGGDGGASYARKTTRLTDGAGLPVRGSARERGAVRWGWLAREREGGERAGGFARGSGLAIVPKGGCAGAREGGGGEREMCPWAISKYFGDLVSNTSAKM